MATEIKVGNLSKSSQLRKEGSQPGPVRVRRFRLTEEALEYFQQFSQVRPGVVCVGGRCSLHVPYHRHATVYTTALVCFHFPYSPEVLVTFGSGYCCARVGVSLLGTSKVNPLPERDCQN